MVLAVLIITVGIMADTPMAITMTTTIGHATADRIDDPIAAADPVAARIAPVFATGAMAAVTTPGA
jgi:hypothetical protein